MWSQRGPTRGTGTRHACTSARGAPYGVAAQYSERGSPRAVGTLPGAPETLEQGVPLCGPRTPASVRLPVPTPGARPAAVRRRGALKRWTAKRPRLMSQDRPSVPGMHSCGVTCSPDPSGPPQRLPYTGS